MAQLFPKYSSIGLARVFSALGFGFYYLELAQDWSLIFGKSSFNRAGNIDGVIGAVHSLFSSPQTSIVAAGLLAGLILFLALGVKTRWSASLLLLLSVTLSLYSPLMVKPGLVIMHVTLIGLIFMPIECFWSLDQWLSPSQPAKLKSSGWLEKVIIITGSSYFLISAINKLSLPAWRSGEAFSNYLVWSGTGPEKIGDVFFTSSSYLASTNYFILGFELFFILMVLSKFKVLLPILTLQYFWIMKHSFGEWVPTLAALPAIALSIKSSPWTYFQELKNSKLLNRKLAQQEKEMQKVRSQVDKYREKNPSWINK